MNYLLTFPMQKKTLKFTRIDILNEVIIFIVWVTLLNLLLPSICSVFSILPLSFTPNKPSISFVYFK